jgi:hypothetical protein
MWTLYFDKFSASVLMQDKRFKEKKEKNLRKSQKKIENSWRHEEKGRENLQLYNFYSIHHKLTKMSKLGINSK